MTVLAHTHSYKGRAITAIVLVVMMIGLSSPAHGMTTKIEVTGTQQALSFDEGDSWYSGPIQHMRGLRSESRNLPLSGLPNEIGTTHATVSFNLDTRTLKGRAWGTATLVFSNGGFSTTFSGDVFPGPSGLMGVFDIVGHGYGAFEGMQLRLKGNENLGTGFTTYEGVLIDPGLG